jgi:prepilin-type N-terminal cleavage/methylation domain-containing protein
VSSIQLPRRSVRELGLTLIELIVTMAILVILAGLVLPKLDVFKTKANKAQAASGMYSIANYVTAYRAQHDAFPDIWDSLLESAGGPGTTLFSKLDSELIGSPPGSGGKLTTLNLTAGEAKSLARVGITRVVDQSAAAEVPADSGDFATLRTLAAGDVVATLNLANSDPDVVAEVQKIAADFYPELGGAIPAGKRIAVFGLGRFNTIKGDLLHTIPTYSEVDHVNRYGRFLVLFELDADGGRANLLGCIGGDGDRLEGEIADYYGQ